MRCACSPSAPAWLRRRASSWSASSSPGLSLRLLDLARRRGAGSRPGGAPRRAGAASDCLLASERGQRRVRLGHRAALRLRVGERVEDVALGVGAEQRLGLVLAVEIDQQGAELAEDRGGGRAAVDPGARAPLGRDLRAARRPAPSSTSRPSASIRAAGARVEALERPFDDGLGGAGPHAAARRPARRAAARGRRPASTCRRRSRRSAR